MTRITFILGFIINTFPSNLKAKLKKLLISTSKEMLSEPLNGQRTPDGGQRCTPGRSGLWAGVGVGVGHGISRVSLAYLIHIHKFEFACFSLCSLARCLAVSLAESVSW